MRVLRSLAFATCFLPFCAPCQVYEWTGPPGGLWGEPANWNPGVPPSDGTAQVRFVNPGMGIISIVEQPWSIRGLELAGFVPHALVGSTITFDNPAATLSASGSSHEVHNNITLSQSLAVSTVNSLVLHGAVGGPGGIVKQGAGFLQFNGSANHAGVTTIEAGTMIYRGTTVLGNVVNDGVLALNAPSGASIGSVSGSGSVSVSLGGSATGTFQHAGTTMVSAGASLAGSIDNAALLTLDGTFNTGAANVGSLSGTGTLNLNDPFEGIVIGGANTSTTFQGVINGPGALAKIGTGTLTLAGNANPGTTTVIGGGLLVLSQLASTTTVQAPALLGGTGLVSAPVSVQAGATLAPGNGGPGELTIGVLTLRGTLAQEINGNAPGTFDRVRALSVDLTGATLALAGSYVFTPLETLVIIANDGFDPTAGTFAGLPEGAIAMFNGRPVRVTYVGGDGNDVALTGAQYTVTSSQGANGAISPLGAQQVNPGASIDFTVAPDVGYVASVGGTCGGTLAGTLYTTNAINADCTVVASFATASYVVTPSHGANGGILPATPQTVVHGAATTFTVTPDPGYTATVGGTCGGALAGMLYTTAQVTANCSVIATFTSAAVTTFTAPSATGTGNITASFTGGGATCSFTAPQFIPVEGHAASPPAGTAPAGVAFPHGLFDFSLDGCTPGSTVTMTITYPSALPPGSLYWKYGPTPANPTPHWYVLPATIAGAVATFTLTDGALGDDDLTANGTIVDQGGPGLPPGSGAAQVPTLSAWMLALLACMLLVAAAPRRKRS